MDVMAAYLLDYMGGNVTPSSASIKTILNSANIEINNESLEYTLSREGIKDIKVTDFKTSQQKFGHVLKQFIKAGLKALDENPVYPSASLTETIPGVDLGACHDYLFNRFSKSISNNLPENFTVSDIPKFKGTEIPLHHIRRFESHMKLKGVDELYFPFIFPLTLEQVPDMWFHSLNPDDVKTWKDIKRKFAARYAINDIEIQLNQRSLEMLIQGENEGFTEFLTRWRKKSTELIKRPDESALVCMFINNLRQPSAHRFKNKGIETFKRLTEIGFEIEDYENKNNALTKHKVRQASFMKAFNELSDMHVTSSF